MSLESHHQFILNTMQRHDDIARKFIAELEAENARLKVEVERLGEENKIRQMDMELLFASYKQALKDIRRLHWDLQTAKEGKPSV